MTSELRSYSLIGQQVVTQVGPGTNTKTISLVQDGNGASNRVSNNTLDYALKKRTGQLPQNYFSFTSNETGARRGFRELKNFHVITGALQLTTRTSGVLGTFTYGASPWGSAAKAAVRTNLYNQAVAKVQSKVKDSAIDLSVVAGELRETRAMFIDIASRFKLAIDAARRKDARAIAHHLSLSSSADFANLWLMINYGMKPFISDLVGAVKALEKGVMKERYSLVKDRAKYTETIVRPSLYETGGIETWTIVAECGVRVKYAVTNPYLATLTSLGLTNPATTYWELVKLSFLVDWVVGIGSWLSQLDYYLGKTYRDGSFTHFMKEKCVFTAAYSTKTTIINGGNTEASQSTAYAEIVGCERTGLITWPFQYCPVIKDPLSVSHVATAASLLRQTWGR